MLIQYSVKNYKSIKDEVIINFMASKKTSKDCFLLDYEKVDLYKTIGLVGPNASGKSNILKSMYFALKFVNLTISRKETSKIKVEHFMLDNKCKDESSTFEFIFIENDVKYVYGFSVNTEIVEEEYLLAYYSKKATTIFERVVGNKEEYNFKGNDVKTQTQISKKTNSNRLYMPVAAEWGYEKVKPVYTWFEKMFRQYIKMNTSEVIEKVLANKELKNALMGALKKADFNISNVFVKSRKMEKRQRDAFLAFINQMLGEREYDFSIPEESPVIWVKHSVEDGKDFSIELENDSSGTRDLIESFAEILYVNDEGGIIIEDEMGRNFHTKLTEYYLQVFNNSVCNKGKAQMIFSTHDTKVLNLLRPEQIYLVDKNEDGGTYVKLLDDYIIREKDNIELGYLKGRYGAIPNIKEC